MWTSWRNRSLWLLAAALAAPGLLRAAPLTGGAIVSIGVSPSSPGPFTAGVSTNTAGVDGGIRWQLVAATSTLAPDPNQYVDLQLFDSGTLVPGALSPTFFKTDGLSTTFGGGLGVFGSGEVPVKFYRAGTNMTVVATVRASPLVNCTSHAFTVYPSTATKLLLVAPGQTFAQSTGTIGTPDVQQPRQGFTLTAVQVDDYKNLATAVNPIVTLVSAGSLATIPNSSHALVAGQWNFNNITINAAKTTLTFTASATGLTPGTVDVVTEGPNPEEVFPFPSPFNPRQGAMTFRFQLNEAKSVRVIVKDRFGQDVWRNDVVGSKGFTDVPWDGRNENGNIVAAGIYIVMLEVDGNIKSKKRFGVSK